MLKRFLVWSLIYCLVFAPANYAFAQTSIQVDPNAAANNQPQLMGTAGGKTQINITTPNSSGLSHNKYTQFDVGQEGVILNNSRTNTQTQLGGWVEGNPNLVGGGAKVILNEVNSSKPSQLKGFVEVGGQKADVIIANPSGINVDGGGFINAGRATLTTGQPKVENGSLKGFKVEGGHIEITGNGLNANDSDYTDIISKSVKVNAGVFGKNIGVTTGSNDVSADNSSAVALVDDTVGVALDVSALGGMYAGHIRLMGTDKGLGVRNAGEIVANVGEVVITSDGRLENAGAISGKQAVRASLKDDLINTNRIQSQGAVKLATAKNVKNQAEIVGVEEVAIETGEDTINTGDIQAGQNLSIKAAGTLDNQSTGSIMSQNISVQAGKVINTGLFDGGEVVLKAGDIENIYTGSILGDHVALGANTILNGLPLGEYGIGTSGLIGARSRLDFGVGDLTNREDGLIYSGGDIYIGGSLDAENKATGLAGIFLNASAVIEALGGLYATVTDFINRNDHYASEVRITSTEKLTGFEFTNGIMYIVQHGQASWAGGPKDWGFGYNDDGSVAISALNFYLYEFTRTIRETFVTESRPGFVTASGDIIVDGNLTNDKSRIMAGGLLQTVNGGAFNNIAAMGEYRVTDSGLVGYFKHVWKGGLDREDKREWQNVMGYNPPDSVTAYEMDVVLNNNYPAATAMPGQISLDGLNSNLFVINPNPSANFLIETNPRLTNYRTWLSSDFMLARMNSDPSVVHKKLGDGFYEQRLIREQIANLTGLRFLDGYGDDEAQYMALMTAGVEFAEKYDLRPGLALSAELMAKLTSDLVWMEEVTVMTADGPVTALAPKVYLAPGRKNIISPGGSIVSAKAVSINADTVDNSGTVYGSRLTLIEGENINNSGTIAGQRVSLTAENDINNIGGAVIGVDLVKLEAGGDINIVSSTATSTTLGGSRTNISQQASVMVTADDGLLIADAGQDLNIMAAYIGSAGSASLSALNDVNIGTVDTSFEYETAYDAKNRIYKFESAEIGSFINVGGDLDIIAGRDLSIKAGEIYADGDLYAQAGRDVSIIEGRAASVYESDYYSKKSGFLSKKTSSVNVANTANTAIASDIGAGTVTIVAGHDFNLRGSNVAADDGLSVVAANDISIIGAENDATSYYKAVNTRTGFTGGFSGGRVSVGYGSSEKGSETSGQEHYYTASMIGSENGTVSLYAGKDAFVSGSHVVAGTGDLLISGENVTIDSQFNLFDNKEKHWEKQSGFSISVGLSGAVGNALNAAVALNNQISSAKDAKSDRAEALYSIAAARSGYDLYQSGQGIRDAINAAEAAKLAGTAGGGGANSSSVVGLSISAAFSKSSSEHGSQSHDTIASGSTLSSGGDTIIAARGDGQGQGGDLTIIGGTVEAGGKVALVANHDLNILSAEELSTYSDYNKSSSSSAGVSISVSNSGWGISPFRVPAAGPRVKAKANSSATWKPS